MTVGDDATFEPYLKACGGKDKDGKSNEVGFGAGFEGNFDLGGNNCNTEFDFCKKGDKTHAKGCVKFDFDGPCEGSTLSPFMGAKWESDTNHVHTHAGLKFKSSLASVGSFFKW